MFYFEHRIGCSGLPINNKYTEITTNDQGSWKTFNVRQNYLYASADDLIKQFFYWSPYIEFLIVSLKNHWHDFWMNILCRNRSQSYKQQKNQGQKVTRKLSLWNLKPGSSLFSLLLLLLFVFPVLQLRIKHIHVYAWLSPLLFTWTYHIINQLYPNIK